MIIVGHLLGFEGDTAKTFEVVIQLGSILAVVVMFWRRLFGLIGIHFGRPPQHEGMSKGRLSLIHILLGMIRRWCWARFSTTPLNHCLTRLT